MKYIGTALVACLAFVIWWLWPEQPIMNYPSDGTDIIAFGDSLIAGVGATPGNDLVSLLEEEIGRDIINLGVNGDTTADGLARIQELDDYQPKVVLLLLGGNDALRRVPVETTKANLSALIEAIHQTGAVVVLLGVRGGLFADGYEQMYADLASEYHTAYVPDVLSRVFGRPELMSDPIHPNNEGYRVIKNRVAPVLQSVI